MIHPKPSCVEDTLTPCFSSDWGQCDRCYRLVCSVHDSLFEVYQSGSLPYYSADMLCQRCIDDCRELGELITGGDAQYINVR
jgi:hypothetical protein